MTVNENLYQRSIRSNRGNAAKFLLKCLEIQSGVSSQLHINASFSLHFFQHFNHVVFGRFYAVRSKSPVDNALKSCANPKNLISCLPRRPVFCAVSQPQINAIFIRDQLTLVKANGDGIECAVLLQLLFNCLHAVFKLLQRWMVFYPIDKRMRIPVPGYWILIIIH